MTDEYPLTARPKCCYTGCHWTWEPDKLFDNHQELVDTAVQASKEHCAESGHTVEIEHVYIIDVWDDEYRNHQREDYQP